MFSGAFRPKSFMTKRMLAEVETTLNVFTPTPKEIAWALFHVGRLMSNAPLCRDSMGTSTMDSLIPWVFNVALILSIEQHDERIVDYLFWYVRFRGHGLWAMSNLTSPITGRVTWIST